jgi:hypothetical protein
MPRPGSASSARTASSEFPRLFSMPLFSNRLITAGIVAELGLILLIDYTAVGNRLFGTAIPLSVWLVMLPFTGGMLVLEELRKAVVRGSDFWAGTAVARH